MHRDEIVENVRRELDGHEEIAFAYVHGSALALPNPRDVDVAVFLRHEVHAILASEGRVTMDFAIPLELALEAKLGMKADVQVINAAPLTFRARVVNTGVAIVDRMPDARAEFEYLSRYEYFDFRPRRREYLSGVVA